METEWKKKLTGEKAEGVDIFGGDRKYKGNFGLHGHYFFAESREKNFYTVNNINFHLNLIILSPLTMVNIIAYHFPYLSPEAQPNLLKYFSTFLNTQQPNFATQHWTSFIRHP